METTTKQITRSDLYHLLDTEFGWAVYRPIRQSDIDLWIEYFYGYMSIQVVD